MRKCSLFLRKIYVVSLNLAQLKKSEVCLLFQTKKGVKRKADTTTPIVQVPPISDPYEPDFDEGVKPEKTINTKLTNSSKGAGKIGNVNIVKVTPNKAAPNLNQSANIVSTPVTAAKLTPVRRESSRPIKKPKRDLPDDTKSLDGENVSFLEVNVKVVILYEKMEVLLIQDVLLIWIYSVKCEYAFFR